jgi:hypothetical protein
VTRRVVLLLLLVSLPLTGCAASSYDEIRCGEGSAGILAAQAVPSATMIPCIAAFPVGWSYGGFLAETGLVRFWMDSDRAGIHAIQVELTETCDTSGAVEIEDATDPPGVQRFELPVTLEPRLSGLTFFTFAGGCVTFRYDFAPGASSTLLLEAHQAIELFPRKEVVAILDDLGFHLCGAEAPPCVGEDAS